MNVVSTRTVVNVFLQLICYLYVENTVQGNNSVVPLKQFCILNIDQFKCCRAFINTLVKLEKVRILVENEFHNYGTNQRQPLKTTDASSSSNSYKNKYEDITNEEFKNHLLLGRTKLPLNWFISS